MKRLYIRIWLAVVLAAVSSMVVGFIWYAKPVFGNRWMRLSGIKEEVLPGVRVVVMPNPAREYFDVALQLLQAEQIQLSLFDQSGKLLQEKSLSLAAGNQSFRFEVGTYPAGTYTLTLKTGKGQVSSQVVLFKG